MARKVIIDCDPGIDDAVALCLALFDARLEVMALTAVGGNVTAELATRNMQTLVERLDPPRFPRLGTARDADLVPEADGRALHGDDGLGNSGLAVTQHHRQYLSEKALAEEVLNSPDEVTIITLGPLTNVARALKREPSLASRISRILMVGGSVRGVGDVTPAAEFNMYYDPISAAEVFASPTTKTLIPLDVTQQAGFAYNLLNELPAESTRAGFLLHRLLPFAFRAHRQHMGAETVFLNAAVGIVAAVSPELFEMRELAGQVETEGRLTTGATVFDRRMRQAERPNMEVALEVDAAAVRDCILRGLKSAGEQT